MISFHPTAGGERVDINGTPVGYIDKDGFFVDQHTVRHFVRIEPSELKIIAERVLANDLRTIRELWAYARTKRLEEEKS